MLRTPTIASLAVATALLGTALGLPASAEARGHRGGRVGVGFGGGYGWGPGPYWGWGWGPGPIPYGYGAQQALLGYAMMSGRGGLDVDAKPNRAEVWVDGEYIADARDLDGDPGYLWLKQGAHHVVLYKAGYKSVETDVDFRAGVLQQLKVEMEKGESQPPVRTAAKPRRAPSPAEAGEPRVEATAPRGDPRAEVDLRVEPRDATIYVDGNYVGIAREQGVLRLPAGRHRVDLARPGYRQLTQEIDVEAGHRSELALSMERGGE